MKKENDVIKDTEKKNSYLIIIIVLLVLIVLALVGYIGYDLVKLNNSVKDETTKVETDNSGSSESTTSNESTNTTEVTDQTDNSNVVSDSSNTSSTSASIKVYSSDDGKYYLVLNEYSVKPINPKGSNVANNFSFYINEYYSGSSFHGSYMIDNGKINLYGTVGCTATAGNYEFNCPLPEGVSVSSKNLIHTIILNYSENEIMLGNVKLTLNK